MITRHCLRTLPWSLLVTLAPSLGSAADDDIRLSTIGYLPDRPKIASVVGSAGTTWNLRSTSDDSVVLTDSLSEAKSDADTAQSIRFADFSAVTAPGSYYLEIPEVGKSLPFRIGEDVFGEQLVVAMLGFYGWRSGTAVAFNYNGTTFRQGPGHLQDGYLDYLGQKGVKRDGSHGWYDAGDYGKYTVNAAFTLGMMLQAWETYKDRLSNVVLAIPEQGGALPDYLDEIKWEYDWFATMQYSDTDPRVSHKLTSFNFASFTMPESDKERTYYSPFGSAATADYVAAMALGSRVYRPYDAALADQMLTAARASYQWLLDNPKNVAADLADFTTGSYATPDSDDRAWAAAELWETTGDPDVLAAYEKRAGTAAGGTLFDTEFDWSNLRNLGIYTYLRSTRTGKDPTVVANLQKALLAAADTLVSNRSKSGYGRASKTYNWGWNGAIARNCMTLQVANQLSPKQDYLDTCADQIAHLYGRNYYNRSFVTGAGKDPPMHPHHRPSAADGVEPPFPGLLVGGPQKSATSWKDDEEDYTSNEVAINWNGALVYALAGFLPANGVVAPTTGGMGPVTEAGGASTGGARATGGRAAAGGNSGEAGGTDADPGTSEPANGGDSATGGAPSTLTNSSNASTDDSGCGCRAANSSTSGAWALALTALAWAGTRRRKSQRRGS